MSRYYRSEIQHPIDTFVSQPLELYYNRLKDEQNRQDTAQAEVASVINKPFGYINTAKESVEAQQTKAELEAKGETLKGLDYNNPQDRAKLLQGLKDIRSSYEPGGQAYAHEANLAAYQDNLKNLKTLLDKGDKLGGITKDQYDYLTASALDKFSSTGRVKNGQYNQYSAVTPAPVVDAYKIADDVGNAWKSNKIQNEGYRLSTAKDGLNVPEGTLFKKIGNSIEYADPNEIKHFTKQRIDQTPGAREYLQQQADIKEYKARKLGQYLTGDPNALLEQDQNGNFNQFNPDTYKSDKYQQALEDAGNYAGTKYGFTNKSQTEDIKNNTQAIEANKQNFDSTPHLDTGSYDPIANNPILKTATNFIDKNGNLVDKVPNPNQIGKEWNIKNGRITSGPLAGEGVVHGEADIENKDFVEQKALINNIKSKAPNSTKGMNDAQVLDYYTKALGNSGQVSYNAFDLNGIDTDKITKHVLDNLSGKKVMVTGDPEATTLSQVGSKLGLSESDLRKEIKEATVNGIKPTSPNNPGAWKVTVVGSDNLPHEITIEGDKDQQNHFSEYNTLMNYDKNGTIGDVTTNNYYSHTDIQETQNPDGTYSSSYGTTIYPLSKTRLTKEEADKAETLGHKVTKTGNNYRLILDTQPIDPESFGRELVHNWSSKGLRNYQEKENTKPTYSEDN